MRAWVFQDSRQKKQLGDRCPWSVGWYDPEGKKRSKRVGSRSMAQKLCRKIEGELAAGTYRHDARKSWKDFRAEYESRIAATKAPESRRCDLDAINHFERIVKPQRVSAIKTQTVDAYVAKRRTERGRKPGSTISPASVNKELRHLKAILRIAHDWGYLTAMPKFRMLREPGQAGPVCDAGRLCQGSTGPATRRVCRMAYHVQPAEWWRGLLTFAYMTGWRIFEVLALQRHDLDLASGTAITRAADNKGRRDEVAPLHSVVIEHVKRVLSFDTRVFSWPHHRRALWSEFYRIQLQAGIHLPCHEKHEHTATCHLYGFHDLRRAFATANAETLTADALQSLMRHKSYQTTQRYINMARQLDRAVEKLHVPPVLKNAAN